eukprot:1315395-Karenia_brevis.AAC.1
MVMIALVRRLLIVISMLLLARSCAIRCMMKPGRIHLGAYRNKAQQQAVHKVMLEQMHNETGYIHFGTYCNKTQQKAACEVMLDQMHAE